MNIEELRNYCLLMENVEESFPFGDDTLVFKVLGKMFALIPLDSPQTRINLKCEPELATELREKYSFVQPGYHMNKTHWNTVYINDSIPDTLLKDWIKHSYNEVFNKIPRKRKG